jgi:hypothetical protein
LHLPRDAIATLASTIRRQANTAQAQLTARIDPTHRKRSSYFAPEYVQPRPVYVEPSPVVYYGRDRWDDWRERRWDDRHDRGWHRGWRGDHDRD